MFKKTDKRNKRHKDSLASRVFVYMLLVFFALVAIVPFYYLIITAFKDIQEASTQATMWPRSFALFENIQFVITHPDYDVIRMFMNTMFVFVMKTVGTVLTCSLAAYGFAMYSFPFKKTIFIILLSAMMIPAEILNLPIYEFMVNTGLKEVAYIPLWIAAWFATDIFMIFLFHQFFRGTPKALIEAARMDGYGEFRIFFKVVLPQHRPVFITVILLYFIGTYNDLYGPALYVTKKSDWLMVHSINIFETLYRSGSSSYLVPWNYVSVASIIALIPVIILFTFMQKQFMESVAGVGIKG